VRGALLCATGVSCVALIVALVASGCLVGRPTRTTRPALGQTPPFEERTVRSSETGAEYRYLFAPGPSPAAPAILLLPGGIFDNRIWLYSGGLAERFNVYALDWPHDSPLYRGRMSDFGDVARDFLAALETAAPDGSNMRFVAGVSMGTFAAIDLVSREPRIEIDALVLASTVMFAITPEEVEVRTGMAERALGFSPERLRAIIEWRVEGTEFDPAPGEVQQQQIFYVRPSSYYAQVFGASANQGDRPQDTQSIDCPVLFLAGTADETMRIDVARLSPTVFQDAELVEFEGYDHAMIFGHGPEMVEAMLAFFDRRNLPR